MTATSRCYTARAWVDVDLSALVANAKTVAAISGGRLLPMVKANGYGLGAVAVARALEALTPWGYGVATVEEGAELRRTGISRPILLCTPLLPEWIDRWRGIAVVGEGRWMFPEWAALPVSRRRLPCTRRPTRRGTP